MAKNEAPFATSDESTCASKHGPNIGRIDEKLTFDLASSVNTRGNFSECDFSECDESFSRTTPLCVGQQCRSVRHRNRLPWSCSCINCRTPWSGPLRKFGLGSCWLLLRCGFLNYKQKVSNHGSLQKHMHRM